jgi:flagellar biosynthesis/type III secretory pathway protein FliH
MTDYETGFRDGRVQGRKDMDPVINRLQIVITNMKAGLEQIMGAIDEKMQSIERDMEKLK